MEIAVNRRWYGTKATIGEMFLDNDVFRQCYTLEDIERTQKIFGQTAIPVGRYRLTLDYSNRFKRIMPHILNVPGFDGIRIHPGNTDVDTDGCILVGNIIVNSDFISGSVDAFEALFSKLEEANKNGEIWITISDAVPRGETV